MRNNNTGTAVTTDSAVIVAVDDTCHNFLIEWDKVFEQVTFSIDGVSVGDPFKTSLPVNTIGLYFVFLCE